MNFGGEHSAHCLRYGQAPRGRRSAYRLEDTTMAPPRRPEIVIGLDVGKPSHWACVATRDGEVLASKPIANRENALDSLFAEFPGALVVDQVRNIGAIAAEDRAVRFLARRIAENAAELQAATAEISGLLERDETYRCLLTIPGIGPKTASELAISIDIDDFPSHDRLASYCGLAPRNRQSGTSVSSVSASRQGNKRLKNLLIFSCNCLARTDGRWGEYYTRCRDRGMPHGKARKAVARKRLKVIYAVMRDKVPYVA